MGLNKKHLHIKEVLKLYHQGVPKKSISKKIGITEKTVAKWITESIKAKDSHETRITALEKELKEIKIKLNKYE